MLEAAIPPSPTLLTTAKAVVSPFPPLPPLVDYSSPVEYSCLGLYYAPVLSRFFHYSEMHYSSPCPDYSAASPLSRPTRRIPGDAISIPNPGMSLRSFSDPEAEGNPQSSPVARLPCSRLRAGGSGAATLPTPTPLTTAPAVVPKPPPTKPRCPNPPRTAPHLREEAAVPCVPEAPSAASRLPTTPRPHREGCFQTMSPAYAAPCLR